MIEFLIELRQFTVYLMIGLFGIAIISFILLFSPNQRKKGLIGIGLLFISAFIIVGMNITIATSLRSELAEKAKFALNSNSNILINGLKANVDTKQLLVDLSKVNGWYFANHTHPETKYRISIISQKDTLDVILKRDSKNPEEYWTYLPKYKYELELDLLKTKTLTGLSGEE